MITLVVLEEIKNTPLGFPIYRKVRKQFDIPGSSEMSLSNERKGIVKSNTKEPNDFYNEELAESFKITSKVRDGNLEVVKCNKGVTVVYDRSVALNSLPRKMRSVIPKEDKIVYLQNRVRSHVNRLLENF